MLGPSPLQASDVTSRLYRRLGEADVAEVRARLSGEETEALARAGGADRERLLLALGVHHRVPAVFEKTGLVDATPPDEVHSMGRGPLAAGGTSYYADMVVDALGSGGLEPAPGMRALDFGCSSGRVVRVLAAAYPELEWFGCDPIESSVAWARSSLPGITFDVSPQEPPLPYGNGAFDFVFAISIWSHFAETAALRWFEEMRRVIRANGLLVLTTHGSQSISHASAAGIRGPEQLRDIARALYRDGYWFAPEFGDRGDHGLVNPEWGTAFCTPEWLGAKLCPRWRVVDFAPGRAEDDQDLYVLSRP